MRLKLTPKKIISNVITRNLTNFVHIFYTKLLCLQPQTIKYLIGQHSMESISG
jgi:hypothetical protein